MAKGLVIGILFGALLGAGAVRLLDRSRAGQGEDAAARSAGTDGAARTGSGDSEALQKELTASRHDNDELQKKVTELQAKVSSAKTKPVVAAKGNPWKEVGVAFFKMKDHMKDPDAGNSPEAQQAFMELLGILGKVAKEYGVGIDEVGACPDAIPSLLLSILDAAGIQPDAAQQSAIDGAMSDGKAAWKDYLGKRDDLSVLERKLFLADLEKKNSEQLRTAFAGPAGQTLDEMHLLDADFNFGGRGASFGGSRESVTESLTNSWAKDLGFDDTQKISMGPVVDTYMREVEAARTEMSRREAAGEKVSEQEKKASELQSMIRAQKRLGETMRLSEAQTKALKNWGTVYGFDISGESK